MKGNKIDSDCHTDSFNLTYYQQSVIHTLLLTELDSFTDEQKKELHNYYETVEFLERIFS